MSPWHQLTLVLLFFFEARSAFLSPMPIFLLTEEAGDVVA